MDGPVNRLETAGVVAILAATFGLRRDYFGLYPSFLAWMKSSSALAFSPFFW